MIFMYKIAVIGDYDSICGFAALGLDIFPVNDEDEAKESLKKLTSTATYGVIYITEPIMERLASDCEKYRNHLVPAIIPIPACTGITGFGKMSVKSCVEQAVGSDIIFTSDAS